MDGELRELLRQIREANPGWETRIRQETIDIQYDSDADILYIGYGEREEAFSIPLDSSSDDVYLRVARDSLKIVGIDIMDFRRTFLVNHPDARELFDQFFNFLGNGDWRIQYTEPHKDVAGQVALLGPAPANAASYFPRYISKIEPLLAA